jgi:hypothetical protein
MEDRYKIESSLRERKGPQCPRTSVFATPSMRRTMYPITQPLNPSYLLGIPPLLVVQFPSTLVPGCLYTDLPPPPSLFCSPTVPQPNYVPLYDDISTSTSHSLIRILWSEVITIEILHPLSSWDLIGKLSQTYISKIGAESPKSRGQMGHKPLWGFTCLAEHGRLIQL